MIHKKSDSRKVYENFSKYYDLYVRNFSEDIPIYLSFCGKDDKILEIGCGSGRILSHFLKNGYAITGVDISQEMLDLSESKLKNYIINGKLKLKNHDFRFSPFKESFNMIMVTWYTFNYILDKKEQESFLKNIYLSLNTGGKLIADLFYPRTYSRPEIENKWTETEISYNEFKILLRDKRKVENGIEERIQEFIKNGTEEEIITYRIFIDKDTIRQLLKDAAFTGIKITDGYSPDGFHEALQGEKAFKNFIITAIKNK